MQLTLQYPNEYLTYILGFIKAKFGLHIVASLKLTSNWITYGPFGPEMGRTFNSSIIDDGKISGFKGRCQDHIDSIEAYIAPTKHAYPFEITRTIGGEVGDT